MYLRCYSRLALGVALPSLAMWITPKEGSSQPSNDNTFCELKTIGNVEEMRSQQR